MPLTTATHSLSLNRKAVEATAQTDLDELGTPRNTRAEKFKTRSVRREQIDEVANQEPTGVGQTKDLSYHQEMAELYCRHILRGPPTVQIRGLSHPTKE